MTKRSVRWGRTQRLLTAAAVGVVAVPTVLAGAAYAGGVPTPKATTAAAVKGPVTVLKDTWGDASDDAVSKGSTGLYQPDKDPGSLFTVTTAIGARAVWGHRDSAGRAITGQGVTVALLDSGVVPVPGLGRAPSCPSPAPATPPTRRTGPTPSPRPALRSTRARLGAVIVGAVGTFVTGEP